MRKTLSIVSLVLAVLLTFSLVSCSGKASEKKGGLTGVYQFEDDYKLEFHNDGTCVWVNNLVGNFNGTYKGMGDGFEVEIAGSKYISPIKYTVVKDGENLKVTGNDLPPDGALFVKQ